MLQRWVYSHQWPFLVCQRHDDRPLRGYVCPCAFCRLPLRPDAPPPSWRHRYGSFAPERRPGTLHKMQHGRSLHALHADFARDILHPVLFQGMYQGGTHVDFVYGEDGSCQTSGAGRPVVEYFRVSGYEWIAAPDDAQAYSTCIDGTVVEQHRTVCSVIPAEVYLW